MKIVIRLFNAKFAIKAVFLFFLCILTNVSIAQTCSYSLNMQDSYGDGWNGGSVKVYVNSFLVGNFSAVNSGSVAVFQLNDGDTLELSYTPGAYENENSYQLYDPAWNFVFGDGPTPQTGTVYSSLGNCNGTLIPGSYACTAIPIDTGQCIVADNSGIQGSGRIAGCANFQGGDIWFSMQVPPSGNVGFVTDSGDINDTGLAVWTDSTCTNPHLLGCDDDSGPGYFSLLNLFDLNPGQTVYIQVWGYGGGTGSFRICAQDLGQVQFDSTELAIVMINTLGQTIIPDNKVNCLMDIKFNGPNSYTRLTDPSNVYSGNIGIEIRGATSSGYPQAPYGFETRTPSGANNSVSILGMPAENDWVLLSNYNDRSLIRNTLAYKLFGEMGQYSVKTRLCEVLVDSSYKGIYVIGEKIKRDGNRVDIATLTTSDTTGDNLTGGYILQQNYWDANNSFLSNYSPIDHPNMDVHFVYEYPKPDVITATQKTYIAAFVDSLESALYSPGFADPLVGYRKYLDVKSFIDYFLVNELSRNNDGFKKSVFFYKDKYSNGGKLKAGPVWDFDWAWKNMYGCSIFENITGTGWAHHINDCPTDNYSCGWYIRLLQDSTFANELRCTYESYRQTILDTSVIFAYIDSVRTLVQNAQVRHFQRWPILGMSGPAPEVNAIATTYNAELDTLKTWITLRLQWLDANIPGNCSIITDVPDQAASNCTLHYYPNPSIGNFHFEGFVNSVSPLQMNVFDITGKRVDCLPLESGNLQFEYKLNTKGVYFFTITNSIGQLKHGKLIVL